MTRADTPLVVQRPMDNGCGVDLVIMIARSARARQLKPHPLLDIIPERSLEEWATLVESVRIAPAPPRIEVLDGLVVVGWDEYRASLEAGESAEVIGIRRPENLVEYVLRRNIVRALSPLDRACIAVLADDAYKRLGRARMAEGGRRKGKGRVEITRPSFGTGERWFEIAARVCGVSANAVKQLARIRRLTPDVFEAVRARRLRTLGEAGTLAKCVTNPRDREVAVKRYEAPGGARCIRQIAAQLEREQRVAAMPIGPAKTSAFSVFEGSCERVAVAELPAQSVDAVVADIVYGDVGQARKTARCCSHTLKRGGVAAVIPGQERLLDVAVVFHEEGFRVLAIGALLLRQTKHGLKGAVRLVDSVPVYIFARVGEAVAEPIANLTYESLAPEKDLHRFQKDLGSTRALVRALVRPGSVVLDPCCGSGTTGVAVLEAASTFIGIDVDHAAVALTRSRLRKVERDLRAGTAREAPAPEPQPLGSRRSRSRIGRRARNDGTGTAEDDLNRPARAAGWENARRSKLRLASPV